MHHPAGQGRAQRALTTQPIIAAKRPMSRTEKEAGETEARWQGTGAQGSAGEVAHDGFLGRTR